MTDEKETTDELLESRREVYGDRVQNMERTAALWSALLGIKIHDWQVPLMMSAYKMFRTFETPDYSDNSDDIDGWKEMFVEVMNANHGGIIQARTVEEYQNKKQIIDAWVTKSEDTRRPRHPYENIERDIEIDNMNAYESSKRPINTRQRGE